jgi:sulfotransferase family protein
MKLIGAGLPRTGTLSQKVGLEMAGVGPCYHMVNVLGDLSQNAVWEQAYAGNADWEEVFAGFESTVDWPGAFYYKELMEAFPDAKVLLSLRDGDAWERSMRSTIWDVLWGDSLMNDMSDARCRIDPGWKAYMDLMRQMWGTMEITADSPPGSLATAIDRYNEEVIATVPSDRLLVWSVAEGWEPLCEFLEIPIPDAPFPRLNESAQFAERIIDGALIAVKEWRDTVDQESAVPAG